MYRFLLRPKWLAFHLLCLSLIAVMLLLAKWQWTRYNERNDFVALVEQRQAAKPQDLATMLEKETPADIEYYRVTASGTYLGASQLIQINRTQEDVNGVDVLTPFQIDNGPIVVVNRGFVPAGDDVPPAPSGRFVIGGTARTTQIRHTGELTDNENRVATEVRRVDLPLIAQRLGLDVAPVYIDFIASEPAASEPPVPVPPPDVSGGPPHLSYTIQWCIFSVCVAVGWVFAVRRSARNYSRAAAPGAAPAVSADEHPAVPSA
jgi:cytochrome oxidase assembly protein ShyY1